MIESLKVGLWRADWFMAFIVGLAMLFASGNDLLQSLERKA